jgi:hypothetical protein
MRMRTWFVPAAKHKQPQMNADKHGFQPRRLSVFICVHPWLILFSAPSNGEASQ